MSQTTTPVLIEPNTAAGVASAANKLSLAASGGAVVFGLTANEVAALGGLAIAFVSLLISVWFKWQHLKAVRQAVEKKPGNLTCEPGSD